MGNLLAVIVLLITLLFPEIVIFRSCVILSVKSHILSANCTFIVLVRFVAVTMSSVSVTGALFNGKGWPWILVKGYSRPFTKRAVAALGLVSEKTFVTELNLMAILSSVKEKLP